jgi:hypothetical protein
MLAPMLKLVLATVALLVSWRWLRAEFSRSLQAGESIQPSALALRGVVLAASTIWFLLTIAATFGRVFGWMLGLAVVGALAWYFLEGRSVGKSELDRRSEGTPDDEAGDPPN